ncbi:hypothetical protein [Streptomyces hygroscopicus]|uniref:hypothetical protein n=1 Tax=Streptomyces hygroscopicus TaxID=1912 RepID=UPI00368AE019
MAPQGPAPAAARLALPGCRSRPPRRRLPHRTDHRPDSGLGRPLPPLQLLTGLTLRAITLTTHTAALIRTAGTPGPAVEDRASVRRADIRTAGVTAAEVTLELGLHFARNV